MQVISDLIEREARPLSAKEILDEGKKQLPKLGLATVYRAIESLLEEGFLVEVFLPGSSKRYEKKNLGHHHFFQCFQCDKAFGVSGCPGSFPQMTPKGFQVEGHEVILYGRCALCVE
jgi:Fur family ferric uptake transcriptional regulator